MASFNPSRPEELRRLAGQISCQSLELRDIVDNIYQRGQSPARPPSDTPSSPPGFAVRQSMSAGKAGGGRRASAAPQSGQRLDESIPNGPGAGLDGVAVHGHSEAGRRRLERSPLRVLVGLRRWPQDTHNEPHVSQAEASAASQAQSGRT
ncbi:hypothetical protein MRX96_039878 [Rhipicephalus microplus]